MKLETEKRVEESLTDELLGLLLEESERAMLAVDARADESGHRVADGAELEHEGPEREDIDELKLAIAELVDCNPGLSLDLEAIGEKMRSLGAIAGAMELESYPQVLDLARLSLEVFFRRYQTMDAYEQEHRQLGDGIQNDEELRALSEIYELYGQLLTILRARLS